MKQFHVKRFFSLLMVICCLLLNACQGNVTDDQAGSESVSSYVTERVPEDTEPVSLVTYTRKHTTTNLSDALPGSLSDHAEWDEFIHARGTFLRGNTLYVFGGQDGSGDKKAVLYHYTPGENGIEKGQIIIPNVREDIPYCAYPLDGGRMVLFYCIQNEDMNYTSSFVIVEADGTVLAEVDFSQEYHYRSSYNMLEFFVDEDEEHNVTVLLYMSDVETPKLTVYRYHNEDNSVTAEGTVSLDNHISKFGLLGACRTAESLYMYPNTDGYAVLDLISGSIRQEKLQIPEDKALMWKLADENAQIYLYDTDGLYQYNGSDAPTRLLEWEKCSFIHTGNILDGQIYVVDSNTFFYKITVAENNVPRSYLYCIQTEYVIESDNRTVIQYDCYSAAPWFRNVVSAFNQTNGKYRVNLNEIDTVGMSGDDVSAHLAESLLSSAKPDMFTMNLRYLSLDTYYDKQAFLDLTPYFGDTLLGCITEALSWNGALYAAPLDMSFQTFVCSDELETDFLTWDEFYQYIDGLAEGENLTTEDSAQSKIFANGIMDFFDWNTKTASYDTDTFRRMVTYTQSMNDYVDENNGRIVYNSDGTYGYSNATLPARIAGGGVKFIDIQINSVAQLAGMKLLFGDEGYTWCGYPSNEGGGAELNLSDRTCIIADSDAAEGCIEFLEFLLSDEWQTNAMHSDLPVTKTGVRSILADAKYNYYRMETYKAIGDPNAVLQTPSLIFPGRTADSYISLSPEYTLDTLIDTTQTETEYITEYQTVELSDAEMERFLAFLDNCHMKSGVDATVQSIVTEELSYWQSGVKSLAEVTKIMQSRVSIYLAERHEARWN